MAVLVQKLQHHHPGVGVRPKQQVGRGPADDLLPAVAGDLLERLVHVDVGAVLGAGDDDGVWACMEGLGELLFGVSERLLRLEAPGDVLGGAEHVQRSSLRVVGHLAPCRQGADRPACQHDAVVHLVTLAVVDGVVHRADHHLPVIRVDRLQDEFVGRGEVGGVHVVDAEHLVGPYERVGGEIPVPVAETCYALRDGEGGAAFPERLLDFLVGTDVDQGEHRLFGPFDGGPVADHGAYRAVSVHKLHFEAAPWRGRLIDERCCRDPVGIAAADELGPKLLPFELLTREPCGGLEAAVHRLECAVREHDGHGGPGVFEYGAVAGLGLLQLLLGAAARGDVARRVKDGADALLQVADGMDGNFLVVAAAVLGVIAYLAAYRRGGADALGELAHDLLREPVAGDQLGKASPDGLCFSQSIFGEKGPVAVDNGVVVGPHHADRVARGGKEHAGEVVGMTQRRLHPAAALAKHREGGEEHAEQARVEGAHPELVPVRCGELCAQRIASQKQGVDERVPHPEEQDETKSHRYVPLPVEGLGHAHSSTMLRTAHPRFGSKADNLRGIHVTRSAAAPASGV